MKEVIDEPTHFENEFIRMKYLPEKNYVEEIWKDFGEDDRIIIAKNKCLEMFKTIKTPYYLTDVRDFKGASPETQRWVRDVWLPELYNVGVRKVALLVGKDIFANFSVNTVINGDYADKIDMQKFAAIEEAEKFLK